MKIIKWTLIIFMIFCFSLSLYELYLIDKKEKELLQEYDKAIITVKNASIELKNIK